MTVRSPDLSFGSAFTTGLATTGCAEGQLRLNERTFANGLQPSGCGRLRKFRELALSTVDSTDRRNALVNVLRRSVESTTLSRPCRSPDCRRSESKPGDIRMTAFPPGARLSQFGNFSARSIAWKRGSLRNGSRSGSVFKRYSESGF
jgi:hypothetical protein